MRIEAITVENFRSITSAKRIPLSNYSVLVGPNNEGKSNILKALDIAMTTLQRWRTRPGRTADGKVTQLPPDKRYRVYDAGYNWSRDFPVSLQGTKNSKKVTEVTIEFKLTEDEIQEFTQLVESKLNGNLPVKISYERDQFDISIVKPGKGFSSLTKKSTKITSFISQKIRFDYIPAVRTADSAEEVVKRLVSNELQVLEDDPRFVKAMQLIDEIQVPILAELSQSITSTVSAFLPSVKAVNLKASQASRADIIRRTIQIDVDDGVKTDISQKGDGVQSLVALALMRHASGSKSGKLQSIIAIEEPESHLHPKAIRDLREVIVGLSSGSQVIISSHSPLLVRWGGDTSTIVVGGNKAVVAKKIEEVRDCLGVMVSDNLSTVEFTLLVEGESDRRIVEHIIEHLASDELKEMFRHNRFKVHSLRGVGKLSFNITTFEQNILGYYVFVDNDAAARSEVENAIKKKVLQNNSYTLCACVGMKESEIEDTIHPEIYEAAIFEDFGVNLASPAFKGRDKWSSRVKACFVEQGKLWSDETERALKTLVADKFCHSSVDKSLIIQKSASLNSMLAVLESAAARARSY